MKITVNDVKRNALKAVFVMLAVAAGFALVVNMEIPSIETAQLIENESRIELI